MPDRKWGNFPIPSDASYGPFKAPSPSLPTGKKYLSGFSAGAVGQKAAQPFAPVLSSASPTGVKYGSSLPNYVPPPPVPPGSKYYAPPPTSGSFQGGGGSTPVVYNQTPSAPPGPSGMYQSDINKIQAAAQPGDGSSLDPLYQMLMNLSNQKMPTPAVGSLTAPEIPRTDISGLYGQFAPGVNSAYSNLISDLQKRQGTQQASFQGILDRLKGSYAGPAADVKQGTQQASNKLNDLVQRFNLQPAMQGQMPQRWAESAGRLENLAGQNQAAQTGAVDTLRTARNQMFDTYMSGAKGAQATALAELASQIASGQSNIDVARSQEQGQLGQAALSGNLDLAKMGYEANNQQFGNQMNIAGLLAQLKRDELAAQAAATKAASASDPYSLLNQAKETTTQKNASLMEDMGSLPPNAKAIVTEAMNMAGGDVNKAISNIELSRHEPSDQEGFGRIGAYIANLPEDAAMQQAIAFLQNYSSNFGAPTTVTEALRQGKLTL